MSYYNQCANCAHVTTTYGSLSDTEYDCERNGRVLWLWDTSECEDYEPWAEEGRE